MRHGKKFNHLSRKAGHRRALLANMASSLVEHKRIQTTLAKAKALRRYMEPLVTKAKDNTTHSRRVVFSYLQNKHAVQELFDNIAGKVGDRPGGYLRIVRIGFRQGDAAEMALIEFVDYNETYVTEKKERTAKKTTRRSRRRGKGKGSETPEAAVADTAVEEEAAETEVVEEAPEAETAEGSTEDADTGEAKDDNDEDEPAA